MKSAPCKDCIDRHINCHSSCEKYKNWQIEDKEEKNRIFQEKRLTCVQAQYKRDLMAKMARKKKQHSKK